MNALLPIHEFPVVEADRHLVELIDTWAKRQIIAAYSFGLCSEELAIRLIRDNNLVNA
jgi:hypothetical protein